MSAHQKLLAAARKVAYKDKLKSQRKFAKKNF